MEESSSSILYQNDSKTVVLLDLPRSIEEAQVRTTHITESTHAKSRHLVSSPPLTSPFRTPEPKDASSSWGSSAQSAGSTPSAQIAELMALGAAENALEDIKSSYGGPWCLPRHSRPVNTEPRIKRGRDNEKRTAPEDNMQTTKNEANQVGEGMNSSEYIIPQDSYPILGTIESERQTFLLTAPNFDLIIMDPPWPNRSARRKRGNNMYQPVSGFGSIRTLLSLIPVASHLSPGGLIAVWVTNSSKSTEQLTSRGGIFDDWQVDLVGEWTWLKVTAHGEPIVDLHSAWRKPWERLLIARRRGGNGTKAESIKRKVIVTVPDIHSRKPNLRGLFDELLPKGYQALEVFARNLTAGWWCWGDQALLYQHQDYWVEISNDTTK